MSVRSDVSRGTIDVVDGSLPAGVKAWGFAPADGAAMTACEVNNSGGDDRAAYGWDNTFAGSQLRALPWGKVITSCTVTGTVTFYIA